MVEAALQQRTKVHWQVISTLRTWREVTLQVTAMLHLICLILRQWCTSRLDKMTTGTRSLSTIENSINLSKKKQSKRRCSTKQSWEDFLVIRWQICKPTKMQRRQVITSIWPIYRSNWGSRKKLTKRSRIIRRNICNLLTRKEQNNSRCS